MEDFWRRSLARSFGWDGRDAFCLLFLTFLSMFSRFWVIQYPRHPVAWEDHQVQVINVYINGSFYLDKDPPLGSMFLAFVAWAGNYQGTYAIEASEYPDMQYVLLRSIPAFFAAAAVPVAFLIVRSFGGSTFGAVTSGLLFLFDNLLVVLGRHVYCDGMLQFFVSAAVLCVALRTNFVVKSVLWWVSVVCESVFVGFCVSTRVWALGVLGFVVIANRRQRRAVIVNLLVSLFIFVLSFCLQVCAMPYHSSGDSILCERHRALLVEPQQHARSINYLTVLPRALELIKLMFKQRWKLMALHHWWNWPFTTESFLLWKEQDRSISAFGNVASWYPILVVSAISIATAVASIQITTTTQLLACGWLLCYVSAIVCGGERGICDYELALIFGILGLSLYIDTQLSDTLSGFCMSAIITFSTLFFLILSSFVYGSELPDKLKNLYV